LIPLKKSLNQARGSSISQNAFFWSAPKDGFVKLNGDDSVTNHGALAACGGVVRNADGVFIFGFSYNSGACTITTAELWAILKGLQLAKDRRFMYIEIESDSTSAVSMISNGCGLRHPYFSLVYQIKDILREMSSWSIIHVNREANQIADYFAKYGLSIPNVRIFNDVPAFDSLALTADASSVAFPRGF
jgi:ribonuclease HI